MQRSLSETEGHACRSTSFNVPNPSIVVRTDLPIRQVLGKPNLAGRMVAWSIQLSEFDILFESRGHIKAQVIADFLVELTPKGGRELEGEWYLSVDGLIKVLIEKSLHFEFKASNNQAEYEALLAGMKLAQELEAKKLTAKSDSKLVTRQINGDYQAKDPQLARYQEKASAMASSFDSFVLLHVPRDQNEQADLLAKLGNTQKSGQQRTVIHEKLSTPTIDRPKVLHMESRTTWMTPVFKYLQDGKTPEDSREAQKVVKEAAKYTLIRQHLYRRGFSFPLLRCLEDEESAYVIREMHEGVCGTHIGRRALVSKIARASYY
ncbi:rnhA, partial [Mucuna pruriens]